MKNKIVMTLATLAFASVATAGEDGFNISGDIATSVFMESGKGANAKGNGTGAPTFAPFNAENSGDFSVDQMEIQLEKAMGNSGVVAGIGYGRIFDTINNTTFGGAPKSTLNLTNAYFHHKVGDTGLSFKLGKFSSGVGYESYSYMNNLNYTRSYAFTDMNPWFFTGLQADYMINEMISVGAVAANGADNSDGDVNESKHMGVNATIKPMEGLSVKLNYLTGRDGGDLVVAPGNADYYDTTRINATIAYTLNSMYDFAFHYSDLSKEGADDVAALRDVEATSMALYAGAKMEMWGAGLRYEMVSDDDGLIFVTTPTNSNDVAVITATGWYNVDQNAVLKVEIASTSADEKVFVDDEGVTDDAMMTYGLGFMYRF
jgi:hypothetical protein